MSEQRQELLAQEIGKRHKEIRGIMYTYQPPQPPDIFYRFLFGHVTAQELGRFIYQADTLAAYGCMNSIPHSLQQHIPA